MKALTERIGPDIAKMISTGAFGTGIKAAGLKVKNCEHTSYIIEKGKVTLKTVLDLGENIYVPVEQTVILGNPQRVTCKRHPCVSSVLEG